MYAISRLDEYPTWLHPALPAITKAKLVQPLRRARTHRWLMSALAPIADIWRLGSDVCFVPIADIAVLQRPRLYSITSSARASSEGGTSRPSALAVKADIGRLGCDVR